jgi:hypothetical protein
MRDDNLERTKRLQDKTYEAYFDPTKKFVAPESEEPVPHLNVAPLENAATRLDKSAQDYKKAYQDAADELQDQNAQKLNQILMLSERALTRKEGLPDVRGSGIKFMRPEFTPVTLRNHCHRSVKRLNKRNGKLQKNKSW